MVATFHLDYLGHRIKYGNLEVGNTTQQSLSTTRPCCTIKFIESFLFWVIFVTYNIGIYILCIFIKLAIFILFLLSSTVMFFLHCMLNSLRYEKILCETDELIASKHNPSSDVIFLGVHGEYIFPVRKNSFFLRKTVFPLVSLSLAYRWVNQLRYSLQTYCGAIFENEFSILNNIVNLTWWT